MTHSLTPTITLRELLDMAKQREPKMARLARRSGVSRATLYRIENGATTRNIHFETYGKLARFVLEAE